MSDSEKRVWISIPLQHLENRKYKVAFSIKELVQESNGFSKKFVGGCTPILIKSDPKNLFMNYKVTCTKEDSDPRGHEVRVQFDLSKIDTSSTINNLDVKCSCGCPAFLYWGAQWNLHQLDSLEGVPRPKLQAPTEKLDKRDTYFICKHIKVVSDRITPAITNVLNNIKNKIKLERIRKDQEREVQENQKDVDRLEEEVQPNQEPRTPPPAKPKTPPAPVKPPVKAPARPKPNREQLEMGVKTPARTRPGVI